MSQAQAHAPAPSLDELRSRRKQVKLPGEDMTIAETLRVMDVAREMREQRETAEELFRHDEVRLRLREKLMRTAAMSGDAVTEAEIDAAIDQYLESLHVYEGPKEGASVFLAHLWIWRHRLAMAAAAVAAASAWVYFFF